MPSFKDNHTQWLSAFEKARAKSPERQRSASRPPAASSGRRSRRPRTKTTPTPRLPRRVPVHARRAADDVPRPLLDHAPVRRLRHRAETPTRATTTCSSRARPASRSRSICPTQMGYDADSPRARGEVGKVGVSIGSVADMDVLLDGLPLDEISTSMTINATAPMLLALYVAVGEEQGVPTASSRAPCRTTCSRSTSRAARTSTRPRPSLRLDHRHHRVLRAQSVPKWNPISISGYHMREAGSTAAQEIAFTLGDGIAYVEAALAAGLDVDEFAGAPVVLLQRAQRLPRRDRQVPRRAAALGAHHERALQAPRTRARMMLRFHAQTAGSTLTAQQPLNNVVRVVAAGDGGGARRLPVPAHQLVRRGARAARPRTPPRSRCAPSRSSRTRPASPTPSTRSAAATHLEALTDALEAKAEPTCADRRAGRHGARDREGLPAGRDSRRRVPRPARHGVGRRGGRRREQVPARKRRHRRACCASTSRSSASRSNARRSAPNPRQRRPVTRALDALKRAAADRREPDPPHLRRGEGRGVAGRDLATPCARSSVSTKRASCCSLPAADGRRPAAPGLRPQREGQGVGPPRAVERRAAVRQRSHSGPRSALARRQQLRLPRAAAERTHLRAARAVGRRRGAGRRPRAPAAASSGSRHAGGRARRSRRRRGSRRRARRARRGRQRCRPLGRRHGRARHARAMDQAPPLRNLGAPVASRRAAP